VVVVVSGERGGGLTGEAIVELYIVVANPITQELQAPFLIASVRQAKQDVSQCAYSVLHPSQLVQTSPSFLLTPSNKQNLCLFHILTHFNYFILS
jgi:hypothetical protein